MASEVIGSRIDCDDLSEYDDGMSDKERGARFKDYLVQDRRGTMRDKAKVWYDSLGNIDSECVGVDAELED